jgi:DNA-binding LacI/PurR family transcriptional regulator
MAVTLTDVAKAAGVSASTVSRTLSRPERVDAATRARIFREIARLGYQPNLAARSLITGRTGNLGVVVPDLANPFFPDMVRAVQLRAHQRGFTVLLVDSDEDPAAELGLVVSLAPQVDGIVLCGARMSNDELTKAQQLAPIMLINRIARGIPAVTIDNAGGTRQAVRHLRALRHRRIGFVGGPVTSRSHQQRLAGEVEQVVHGALTGHAQRRPRPIRRRTRAPHCPIVPEDRRVAGQAGYSGVAPWFSDADDGAILVGARVAALDLRSVHKPELNVVGQAVVPEDF